MDVDWMFRKGLKGLLSSNWNSVQQLEMVNILTVDLHS